MDSLDTGGYVFIETAHANSDGTFSRNKIVRHDQYQPNGKTDSFTSYMLFDKEILRHVEEQRQKTMKPSVRGYNGPALPRGVIADFDSKDNLEKARKNALHYVRRAAHKYGIPEHCFSIYFSGHKGFLVSLPAAAFGGLSPDSQAAHHVGYIVRRLTNGVDFPTLDEGVYDVVTRLLRVPNTRHGETGFYKIPLTMDELATLSMDAIKELAKQPRHLPKKSDIEPVPALVDLYKEAKRYAPLEEGTKQERKASPDADGRIQQGEGRNNALTSFAGWLRRQGYSEEAILKDLRAHNVAVCVPPLEDEEVQKIAASVARYEPANDVVRVKFGKSPGIPKIQVNNRHLREVTADALEALREANAPPEVFVRAGALVRVREDEHGTPQIQLMELNHVRGRLARVADFVRVSKQSNNWTESNVNPPEVVVKDLMALSSWPFPALEAVVESPILRPDGSIFDTPGYDNRTRLYYRPVPGFECPEIPVEPTWLDVRRSLELVNEAIGEFPYSDESSAANTLALLVTLLIRHAIQGPVPLGLIDAPQAGTGKTLLAEIIALTGTGRAGEMLGAPRDDEEWRKQITSKLAAGGTMVIVDNVEGSLYAPSLARALTSRTWTDRVLGRSEMVTVSQQATWIATGNNIILRGDLPRRCYWIRLDAKQSRPWKREDFKHPDLTSWVEKKRGELVGAVLTIARAWYAAGKPKAEGIPRLGSFECWTEIIGGILAFAGIKSFLSNLEELYSKADEGNAEWEAFLEEWWRQRGEDPITVKDLTKLINDKNTLKDALPGDLSEALDKGEGSFTRRLGKAIAKRAGTRYGEEGLHITEAGKERAGKLWSVQDSLEPCEFASFAGLYNPSASKKDGNECIQEEGYTYNLSTDGRETNSQHSQTCTDSRSLSSPNDSTRTERRLTEEEVHQVQKLISEGMEPSFARAEVIGEEA